MTTARKLLGPLALALYLALLLPLSGLAAPTWGPGYGADLLLGHLADPTQAALLRGAGLVLVGATLLLVPRLVPAGAVGRGLVLALVGALTLVLPGLLPGWASGASLAPRLALALVGLVLLALVSKLVGADEDEQPEALAPPLGELLRDLGGGLGLALALGALWHRLALVGYHEPAEDHLRLAVLLGLSAVGCLAFAPSLTRGAAARGVVAAVGPALVALGCLAGLWLLVPATTNQGLTSLLAGLGGLDLTDLGGPKATAVLAARSLVAAGFALGLLVGAASRRRGLAFLAVGAGLGAGLWPLAVERMAARPEPFAMGLALTGLALAAVSALPVALAALRRGPAPARLALPLVAVVALGGWLVPRSPVAALSPWDRVPVEPLWQRDTPLGLLTVEPTPLGDPVLVLDRVGLTPPPQEVASDAARFVAALDLAAANWQPGDPKLEVLLAGHLTLARLEAFEAWTQASDLDARLTWTTPWDAWQAELRPLLETAWRLPDPLPLDTATDRIGAGIYDLVVVPQAFGVALPALEAMDPPRATPPPALPPLRTTEDQPAVVFVSTEAPLAWGDLSPRVLITGSDLDHLALGLVAGLDSPELRSVGPIGAPPSTLARLSRRAEMRPLLDRAEAFERLTTDEADPLVLALAAFFSDQVRSSPWAEPDERLELDQARLEALAAATEVPLDDLGTLTWDHLARVLVTKRLSGETFAVVPGLLERLGSFPPLEYALARAYFEMLMPAEGAELLLPHYEAGLRAPEPLMDLGWALGRGGDWARAAEVYGVVLEELPGFHHAARLRALAELRAGMPQGSVHAAELLEEDPADEELRSYLLPGAQPEVEPAGFDPNPLSRLGDGHEH